jgi:hypothetical protein
MVARKKPVRNPAYLRWIRSLPCIVCRSRWQIEAAHTGPHGLGQKSSDLSAIPLCARHHRTGNDSYHDLGPSKFAQVHQLNIREIVARLSGKSRIRIEQGSFVGQLGDEEYKLGPVRAGLARALYAMAEFRRARELDHG